MAEAQMLLDRSSPVALAAAESMELQADLADLPSTPVAIVHDLDMDYGHDEIVLPGADDHEMSAIAEDKGTDLEEMEQPEAPVDIDLPIVLDEYLQAAVFDQAAEPSILDPPPLEAHTATPPEQVLNEEQAALPEQDMIHGADEESSLVLDPRLSSLPLVDESTLATVAENTANYTETTEEVPEDAYADAPEVYEPVASTSAMPYDPSAEQLARPTLQKDYLSHIDLQSAHGHGPTDVNASRFSPHVSLSYNGSEYSLFRPSSSPSGDDEEVLFSVGDGSAEGGPPSLYYSSLESLIEALHLTFPTLKGDGDLEVLLDFNVLDLQISQDNVYSRDVSLFDLDRIRIGLCQPEFDRLQITVKTIKRFSYRFNELAEHCYRMFSGSDDSGTVYDDNFDPLPDQEAEAEALQVSQADATLDQPSHPVQPSDYDQTAADPPHAAADGEPKSHAVVALLAGDVPSRAGGPVAAEPSTYLPRKEEGTTLAAADSIDEHGDVHPPTDDYYEDPEFSLSDDVAVEEYVEDEGVEEGGEAQGIKQVDEEAITVQEEADYGEHENQEHEAEEVKSTQSDLNGRSTYVEVSPEANSGTHSRKRSRDEAENNVVDDSILPAPANETEVSKRSKIAV